MALFEHLEKKFQILVEKAGQYSALVRADIKLELVKRYRSKAELDTLNELDGTVNAFLVCVN